MNDRLQQRPLASLAILCAWGALLCGATAGWGRDIFVDNLGGDDQRDGAFALPSGETAGPVRTIRRALQLAQKSDRIILTKTDEPYRESVTLQAGRHSGTPAQPFIIEGNGAILEGTQPVPARAWEHARGSIYRFRPTRLVHQLLYLDGKPAVRRQPANRLELPPLQPGEWCMFDNYLHFCTDLNRFPNDYTLSLTALPVGITLYEVRHVRIREVVCQGFQLDGINAHDNARDVHLIGLTCRGNGRAGISVGGASQVTIQACLVGNNGTAQVRTEGESRTNIVNCDLLENTAPALVRDGGYVTLVGPPAAP